MIARILAAVRVKDWWHFILPPIIGYYFLGLPAAASYYDLQSVLLGVCIVLSLSVPVAALGFFINEWTDIADDARAGKKNFAVALSPEQRWGVFVVLLVLLVSGQVFLPLTMPVRVLVLIQVALFVLYSCRPFRFKRIPALAILLDGLYSGTVFFVLAFFLNTSNYKTELLLLVIGAGLFKGVRNIIYHFIQDVQHDEASGIKTIAHHAKKDKLLVLQELLWYLEAALLLCLAYFSLKMIFWILLAGVVLLFIKRKYYARQGKQGREGKSAWLAELNILHEVWLPVAAITGVFIQWGWWYPVLANISLMIVFPGTLKIFSELYIALFNFYYLGYNIYYAISDLYFIHTKPHFDIGKMIRKLKR